MAIMYDVFTRKQYELLPEGFPAQLIDGQLIREPAPTFGHQSVQMRIVRALIPLVAKDRLLVAPADVLIDDWNIFQPDILVLSEPPADRDQSYVGIPRAAFEILSPSTAARDRGIKTAKLLGLGVDEVWLVDLKRETVERVTPAGPRIARGDESLASDAVPGFHLVPARLFG